MAYPSMSPDSAATQPWTARRYLAIAGGFLVLALVIALFSHFLPDGIDWRLTYRPATLAFLQGRNPFDVEISPTAPFFAAPWSLIILAPLALLPLQIGRAILFVVSIVAFAYTTKRLGANLAALIAFLLSPPVMHCLLNANMEWLPLLGFVLPPRWGLFLITIKPQTGFAVAIFWLVEAWRKGGVRQIIHTFLPVTVAFLLSFALYGLWPLQLNNVLTYGDSFNSSLWPMSIPVGLTLIVAAIHKRKMEYALPASPALSPYVLFHSWSSAVVALSAHPLEMITAVTGLWILILIRATQL